MAFAKGIARQLYYREGLQKWKKKLQEYETHPVSKIVDTLLKSKVGPSLLPLGVLRRSMIYTIKTSLQAAASNHFEGIFGKNVLSKIWVFIKASIWERLLLKDGF